MNKVNPWNPFEDRPRPTLDCLMHEAILVQAWKKTHDYIRSHNWYSDVLELDISTATLPEMIQEWQEDFTSHGPNSLKPKPMRAVPAPKGCSWEFGPEANGNPEWRPQLPQKDKPYHLRPLAHLDIKAQSLASALMLCLADVVEDAQGNPTPLKGDGEIYYRTVSYGNRLFCDWGNDNNGPANFRWGNANCYRKYFLDYQTFLERPKEICRQIQNKGEEDNKLAVVSLDLTGFYDYVDIGQLLERLKQLCEDKGITQDHSFWEAAEAVMSWEWHSSDQNSFTTEQVFRNGLPKGLPQGLVASGFFSNVVMNEFDGALTNNAPHLIHDLLAKSSAPKIKVLDYCRYVDDMRLVVSHSKTVDRGAIKKDICQIINSLLTEHRTGQQCNDAKTDYLSTESIESKGSDAIMMKSIQTAMSGPMDSRLMEETSIILSGLLNSVDDLRTPGATDSSFAPSLELAKVHRQSREVRDDTIVRFVSYRQLKMLRARREQLGVEAPPEDTLPIDAEIEMAARKMVHLWTHDPSLSIVLRHSLKLFPHPAIFDAVRKAAEPYFDEQDRNLGTARLVALYNIADLLKSAVIDILRQPVAELLPHGCDVSQLSEGVANLAKMALMKKDLPWYLHQQAALALISLDQASDAYEALSKLDGSAVDNYLLLAKKRLNPRASLLTKNDKAFAAVARQFQPSPATIPPQSRAYPRRNGKWNALGRLLEAPSNPFVHEHATLRLIEEILKQHAEFGLGKTPLPPGSFQVNCPDWPALADPTQNTALDVQLAENPNTDFIDVYTPPDWVTGKRRWLMTLGMLARSAFIGNQDYTEAWRDASSSISGYQGIRTSWAKRRYGMFQRSDGLAGPSANCSSWFSELLSRLLPWPGALVHEVSLKGWDNVQTPNDLLKVIKQQREALKKSYARASRIPVYTHEIGQEFCDDSKLTVVMIQTVLPKRTDFKTYNLDLSDPKYLKRRRDHLAAMLRLAESHLKTRKTYGEVTRAHITLIPEFSVHRDDLYLVERYVDRTKSIVFCGLVFHPHPINQKQIVSSGRWVIPDVRSQGRDIRHFYQGKEHMSEIERDYNVKGYRPYQIVFSVRSKDNKQSYKLTGSLCYDATDLSLAADLRNHTDFFIVAANNQDVGTFDSMASSLNYLMYQHYAIVNSGEFGGTLIHAPYKEHYERILTHQHGGLQASISIAEVSLLDWINAPNKPRPPKGRKTKISPQAVKEMKARPAGVTRR